MTNASWPRLLLLLVGIVCCSTSALFIKAAQTHAILVAMYRLLLAGILLLPAFLAARKSNPSIAISTILRSATPAALLLAVHFWSWNIGVRKTYIANASLICNLVAVAMPFVIWFIAHERLHRREVLGTLLALAGTALLASGDLHLDWDAFVGDMICFGSMLLFTVYLAWSRRCSSLPSIWLYVTPVYLIAGIVCALWGALQLETIIITNTEEWLLMAGLAVVPTVVGHTILNRSMQTLRSQLVAVASLGQFIPASLLAWIIFDELPGWIFPVSAGLVSFGCLIVIYGHRPKPTPLNTKTN